MAGPRAATRPIVGGILASALVLGFTPQLAAAASGEISVPIPSVPATIDIEAVSGNAILARFGDDYRLSNNAGATWTAANLPLKPCADSDDCWFSVGRVEAGVVPVQLEDYNAGTSTVAWFSLTANKGVGVTQVASEVDQSAGSYAALDDPAGFKVLKSDGTSWTLDDEPSGLFADGSVLVVTSTSLQRVTADGSRSTLVARFDSDEQSFAIGGNVLAYTDGTQLCVRTFATAAHCVSRSDKSTDIDLVTSAGVLAGDDVRYWYPLASGAIQAGVKLQLSDAVEYAVADSQDDQAPIFSAVDPSGSRLMLATSDGSLQQLATVPATVRARPTGLALTPTSLVGVRSAGGYTDRTWARSVGSAIGAERTLFDHNASAVSSDGYWVTASAVTSAGRWAAAAARTVIRLFDGDGARSTSVTAPKDAKPVAMSGLHLLARVSGDDDTTYYVWNPAAGWQKDAKALGIFGSLVLESTAKVNAVTVRDTAGESASVTVTLPGGATDCYSNFQLWGDWVAANHYVLDPDESDGCDGGSIDKVVAKNFRTGASATQPGSMVALGDGAAVVLDDRDDATAYSVWNLKTGASTQLSGPFDWNASIAIDGSRVAYSTTTDLVVKTISGIGGSAPRSLGVAATGSFNPNQAAWSMDVDLTKPVQAGALEIRNAAGALVRSVTTPASANGSLRGVLWDGKDSAGRAVPAGAYTYKLTSLAADGSGATRAVDGADRALGKVTVAYGLAPATPQISGSAVFGKKLTVKAGTWKPSKVKLSYQWLRGGQSIAKATKSTYQVGVKDIGKELSVRVTGKKSGYRAVSVESARTATVVAATFTKTYAPSIHGTPKVGKKLTAKVKTWSPKASLAYQWLRDGAPIAKATKSTYKVGALDAGHAISVQVKGSKTGYTAVVKVSTVVKVP